jgi:hypothetical protein
MERQHGRGQGLHYLVAGPVQNEQRGNDPKDVDAPAAFVRIPLQGQVHKDRENRRDPHKRAHGIFESTFFIYLPITNMVDPKKALANRLRMLVLSMDGFFVHSPKKNAALTLPSPTSESTDEGLIRHMRNMQEYVRFRNIIKYRFERRYLAETFDRMWKARQVSPEARKSRGPSAWLHWSGIRFDGNYKYNVGCKTSIMSGGAATSISNFDTTKSEFWHYRIHILAPKYNVFQTQQQQPRV